MDSVARGNGEWWAQPGHGKWAEDMTAEVGMGQVRKFCPEVHKLHSAFFFFAQFQMVSPQVLNGIDEETKTGSRGALNSWQQPSMNAPSQAQSGPCLDESRRRELPEMHPGMGKPQLLIIPKMRPQPSPRETHLPVGSIQDGGVHVHIQQVL